MQETKTKYQIVWFTTNLRVHDNAVLYHALQTKKPVIAVFCFDPRHFEKTVFNFKKTERYRAKFLIETVSNLRENLAQLNVPLLIYQDRPEQILPELAKKYNSTKIYHQREFTAEEIEVINAVTIQLNNEVKLISVYDQFLFHPEDIRLKSTEIPHVFTQFRKHVEKTCTVRHCVNISAQEKIEVNNTTEIPSLNNLGFHDFEQHPNSAFSFSGGESSALQRLYDYVFQTKKIGVYKKTRNGLIGPDYSSKFSPWLANGSISARTIYWSIKSFEHKHFSNQSTYWLIFELIWRDYFKYIALKHGNSIFQSKGILNKNYQWYNDEKLIDKWINGKTKEPFVNANMIELNKTGWMSNRGRQNVASYFAKNLELDWRIGAAYFESLLIDYDVHSNYGNWLYVSGVGNDPRDRKFNITLQAERYDPNGKFQNVWLQNTLF